MANKQVTIYTKPNCMQCNFTKKFLDENQISYDIQDVTASDTALAAVKEMGFHAVPVIVSEVEKPFYGFRPDLLEHIVASGSPA